MKKFIVTTTINEPTGVLAKHAKDGEWEVIVAGDLKTPHEKYNKINNLIYLHPDYQEKRYRRLSDLIGWKCIQRRNFAILEAYDRGAEVIAIIDDDNVPKKNWGKNLSILNTRGVESLCYYNIKSPAFDPLFAKAIHSEDMRLWHRGFPIQLVVDRLEDCLLNKVEIVSPSIQADLWDGEPDVDAICRMIYRPQVVSWSNEYISSNKPSPFNSQNTFMLRSVIKDYFLFPHIGRMDDIWASYYVQSLGHKVVYGPASVYSDRSLGNTGRYSINEDMKKEYIGYENTLKLIEDLEKSSENIENYLPKESWLAFCEYKKCIDKIGG